MTSLVLPVGTDDSGLAESAAMWLARFYRDASAKVANTDVVLTSQTLAGPDLERLWRVALLNERTHSIHAEDRRRLIAELTQ